LDLTTLTMQLDETTDLQYDSKQSPYKWGNEAIFLGLPHLAGSNNCIKSTDNAGISLFAFTYKANSLPAKHVLTSPSVPSETATYYYK
jgi:hypothetical protein